jgi:secreted PhoX family phosphatase
LLHIHGMATLGRRKFIITGGAATLGLSLATLVTHKQARALTVGELVEDPEGILDLPAGFHYRILEEKGDDMDDGYRVPGRPDGMACFAGPGSTLILMRNHEVSLGDDSNGPYGGEGPDMNAYDPDAMGGVTRMVVDATSFERLSSNLVLIGTVRNCAGGPSPWGWISCEENTDTNGGIRHGYAFVCPIDAESVQPPEKIEGYGRYNHEAAAIDPSNNYAYLTEDRGDGCLYRFVPNDMAEPFVGKLQALKVVGEDQYDVGDMADGAIVDVEWVDIDEPDPDGDTVRDEGHGKGAAVIKRGEGIWFFEGQVYICSTSGGGAGIGQVLRLIDGDKPTLEVVVQSSGADEMQKPDNITVAPWGELFLAEDGDGTNHIRWVTADGEIQAFARNAGSSAEFAGVCFSPKGDAMFVNMQGDHRTLVVMGPFPAVMDPGGDDGEGETTDEGGETDESGTATGEGEGDGAENGTGNETGYDTGYETGTETGTETGMDNADEVGDDGAWPGLVPEADAGCACAATEEPSGLGALATGLATLVLGTLGRERESVRDSESDSENE